MLVDGDQAILLVSIKASMNGGELKIELPRDLIDSKTPSDTDKPFWFTKMMLIMQHLCRIKYYRESANSVIAFNNEGTTQIQGTEVFSCNQHLIPLIRHNIWIETRAIGLQHKNVRRPP